MDKNITVRFFDVERFSADTPRMLAAFREIEALALGDRECEVVGGCSVRLERLEEINEDIVVGEITRIQDTNFPSEVHEDGTQPLGVDGPLGHSIVFLYDQAASVLVIQYDTRIFSPGRLLIYLSRMVDRTNLQLTPILRTDAWERFGTGPARTLSIKVASPQDMAHVEGLANDAAMESLRRMSEAYEAPMIEIKISVGRRRAAHLADAAKNMIRELVGAAARGEADVKDAKIKLDKEISGEEEPIDLLNEILREKDELQIPDNDPEQSYQVRRNYVLACARKHGYAQ